MPDCDNHPGRRAKAKGLCGTCYEKSRRASASPERKALLKERRKLHNSIHNPRRYRRPYHLKYHYGLTEDEYSRMLDEQNNSCYCCKRQTRLVIDHNHTTGMVRKLLCHRCNYIAGVLEDAKVNAVIEYLEEHSGWSK